MATKSILQNVQIKDRARGRVLGKAMEKAQGKAVSTSPKNPIKTSQASASDLKAMFGMNR